jgi:acetyltransferase-like isoleucine patch superfamily enzyme
MKSAIEHKNVFLNKTTPLTDEEKGMFRYFGVNAKITPPFRILNPHRISIGDRVSIAEHAHINAFQDLVFLKNYIHPDYIHDFREEDYLYDSNIEIGNECQIGRFLFITCTNRIHLENNVLLSERVFIGDNNHSFSHPAVPIMQQPNKPGKPVLIKYGGWIGVGAAILPGTEIGKLSVVGANSVCQGIFPDYAVIGAEKAKLLFTYNKFDTEI